jgi:hypothetical protein
VVTVNPSPKVVFFGKQPNCMFRKWQFTNNNSKSNYRNGNLQLDRKRSCGNFWATPSGTNTIPTQTLVNLTTNPLTVTYTAAATFENNGVSCSGPTLDYNCKSCHNNIQHPI